MTKEIIINGVDVAGCEHHLSTGYCQLQMIFQGMVLKLPFGKHLECNLCDKDCYYKQLKHLEQENERLKEENVKLLFAKGALVEFCNKLTKIIDEKKEKENKILHTLQEIKEIVEKNIAKNLGWRSELEYEILQKITKAESEG